MHDALIALPVATTRHVQPLPSPIRAVPVHSPAAGCEYHSPLRTRKRSNARSSRLSSRCAAQWRGRCERERRRKADAQARHVGSARAAVRVRVCSTARELLRQCTLVESGMRQPMTGRLGHIPTFHVIAARCTCSATCCTYVASYPAGCMLWPPCPAIVVRFPRPTVRCTRVQLHGGGDVSRYPMVTL